MGGRTIGVIGGLGPEATVDFFRKVLERTPAQTDQEHLHLIIDNDPAVPNRNEAIAGRGPSPGPHLAAMARRLEDAGADLLVMVCNAAHAFAGEIEASVSIPLLSIIDATTRQALRDVPTLQHVSILASSGCLEAELYQRSFAASGVSTIVPQGEERARFMQLLYAIKSGDKSPAIQAAMRGLAEAHIGRGAQAVIAGCTEVPLVLLSSELTRPLVSSTDALVEAAVEAALSSAQGVQAVE